MRMRTRTRTRTRTRARTRADAERTCAHGGCIGRADGQAAHDAGGRADAHAAADAGADADVDAYEQMPSGRGRTAHARAGADLRAPPTTPARTECAWHASADACAD